jgi:PIN domain nuclease of toxin-antitoxin system
MRLLLDTHVLLWFIAGSDRVTPAARQVITRPDNLTLVSIATLWEMAIMASLGRFRSKEALEPFILRQLELNGFHLLHVQPSHACRVAALPFHHRDPFDRLLAAQCLCDDLTLISSDAAFDAYGVSRTW